MNHFEVIAVAVDELSASHLDLSEVFQELDVTEHRQKFSQKYSDAKNHVIELEISYLPLTDSIYVKLEYTDENDDNSALVNKEFGHIDKLEYSTISKYIDRALTAFEELMD